MIPSLNGAKPRIQVSDSKAFTPMLNCPCSCSYHKVLSSSVYTSLPLITPKAQRRCDAHPALPGVQHRAWLQVSTCLWNGTVRFKSPILVLVQEDPQAVSPPSTLLSPHIPWAFAHAVCYFCLGDPVGVPSYVKIKSGRHLCQQVFSMWIWGWLPSHSPIALCSNLGYVPNPPGMFPPLNSESLARKDHACSSFNNLESRL